MNYYVASDDSDRLDGLWMGRERRVVKVRRMGSFMWEGRMDGLGEKGKVVCVKRLWWLEWKGLDVLVKKGGMV